MFLFDTLTHKKKKLPKPKAKPLRLFVCGPTVYDYSHIGHARTYIAFDMLVKYLRYIKYNVFYLQNITDVDDKIIARAQEEKISAENLAKKYTDEYLKDMHSLGITSVNSYANATEYIKEIIEQVKLLLEKGYAYEISDDGIYYDISKFSNYGKLSGRTVLQAEDAISRIDDSEKKRNRGDFALWKFSKPQEPKWESPWGLGRPGWHIEDTAIAQKVFNSPTYELHGAARDLIFPHHEAEIAQMESAYGIEPMVEFWLHTGFLELNGQKMSKSLKNFTTIQETLKQYSPQTLRFFFATKHYRSPIDYTNSALEESQTNETRLTEFWNYIKNHEAGNKTKQKEVKVHIENFWNFLEDDFNTPRAFAELFELISFLYKNKQLNKKDKKQILEFLKNVNDIFGIVKKDALLKDKSFPKNVRELIEKRENFRKEKNWKGADETRDQLLKLGYTIDDTKSGVRIKKIDNYSL